ncbi:SDR family oxidoreductase [Chamaesiphon minutus]|uniref:Short-chain dehydrogenase, teichoic and lipoteichoic acid D-alanine esterification n=1 Tax=Chamaesiphon minutus (strain ATCC 27169 / PCC 6605) TaxID=1173020 RepID=K9UL43_CHAP6|nr:SDR family oxidoreductase [Chamaesiphon minutus]AFY95176.1 short-chain dehydrogenase, teichoic and lipoteichoic acid D-alanine esterification [Chamaesiphon minutus PCC 6605]
MKTTKNTVLITGGTSGIGLALAKQFVDADNQVIVTVTNVAKAVEIQKQLPNVKIELADMRDRAALDRLASNYQDVNILINNVGIQYNYDFADLAVPFDKIEDELDINLVSHLYLTKQFLPQFLTKQSAAIVNISSGLAIVPKQSAPIYCASKAALHSFSRALRWQLENTNIKVFEIIPPIVDTLMTAGRGRGKISPEALVAEFWHNFERDRYEVQVGKTKLLVFLDRLMPTLAERFIRSGL